MARVIIIVVAVLLGGAVRSAAQATTASARGTVFGSSSERATSDRLDLTLTATEAHDSEAPPELRSRIQQKSPQSGGFSSMLTGGAEYEHSRRTVTLNAEALTAFQYYPRLDKVVALTHNAGIGSTIRLGGSSALELGQTADYSPSYLYRLFPSVAQPAVGETAPGAPDYRVDESRSVSNSSLVSLRSGSSRGIQVSGSVEHRATNFYGGIERPDLDTLAGRAKASYGVGRTGAISVEYEYRTGEFGYGAQATEQRLRIGTSYSPALSVSRRAQFRFNVAPSVIEIPAAAVNTTVTGTLVKVEGETTAEYPFLRSWVIGGSYRRGLEYIEVFRAPVFRDAARLELKGLVNERVDVTSSAGYVVGESILQRDSQTFDTYTGTVRARYSVTRSIAIYTEYLYYYYNLRGQTALAPDLPSVFEQHGVRAGLMLWTRPVSR